MAAIDDENLTGNVIFGDIYYLHILYIYLLRFNLAPSPPPSPRPQSLQSHP